MGRILNGLGGRRAPAAGSYDVFLIAGQSNALGAGVGYDPRKDRPYPSVHQFAGSGRKEGKTLVGEHPLWHHTRAPGVGFGPTFGRLQAESTGRPVLLVPTARGESGFHPKNGHSWDVQDHDGVTNLFRFACQQVKAALAAHPGSVLRGMLWHQGESDVHVLSGGEYAERLDGLIAGFRREFGPVPFVLGQMSPDRMAEFGGNYPAIDAAHRATPERMPMTAFVQAPTGLFNSPEDKLHFSAEGQRELGRRYYEQYRHLAAAV